MSSRHLQEVADPSPPGPVLPAGNAAVASLIVPGLGQFLQRRYGTALIQLASMAAFCLGALGVGGRDYVWLALAFNVWSPLEALWWARGVGQSSRDESP
jgi:hypothetical protein